METENQVSKDIINAALEIQQDFPELSKYINEMPVANLNVANPEITVDDLSNYSESLNELVTKYSKGKR